MPGVRNSRSARKVALGMLGVCCLYAGWRFAGCAAKPGRFVNSVGMVMVRIAPGSFIMGSSPEEKAWARKHGGRPEWIDGEHVPETVAVKHEYWIGETEVTVAQFRAFAGDSGYRTVAERGEGPLAWSMKEQRWILQADRSWKNPGYRHDDTHPSVCLTGEDAEAFCVWLTGKERSEHRIGIREQYRLPFESEWEFACRGGHTTYFPWGDEVKRVARYANIVDDTPLPDGSHWSATHMPWTDGWAFTAPVRSFAPTSHGLYDLHGNVWEWCRVDDRAGGPSNPAEVGHVLRGGSWDNLPGNVRCASRRLAPKEFASDTTGFRVVLAASTP